MSYAVVTFEHAVNFDLHQDLLNFRSRKVLQVKDLACKDLLRLIHLWRYYLLACIRIVVCYQFRSQLSFDYFPILSLTKHLIIEYDVVFDSADPGNFIAQSLERT